ncbi:MAG: CBS domain-containing protein [Candidatus Bathyarchaeota archaeon]
MSVTEDIMTKKVATVKPSSNILEAQQLMAEHRIYRVVVIDSQNKPVGIITQKDIVNFLVTDTSRRSVENVKAEEVMSKGLVTVKPIAPIPYAAGHMTRKKISSLIVADSDNKLKGIVTKTDVVMYLAIKGAGLHKVREFMTKKPITVKPTDSIFTTVYLMAKHKISRVVVTDNQNKPIGIVALSDTSTIPGLFKPPKTAKDKPIFVKGIITPPYGTHLLLARDIMTANPIAVTEDSDLAGVAKLMTRHGFSGLPVVDKYTRKLLGIVTKSDLTRAVASWRK